MPNDLSTLNGSLVEMKDQLIYELDEKGVTATYDPTTGLMGLIHKISEISGGGKIVLTCDSTVISQAHSSLPIHTATLTATYSEGAGALITVYMNGTALGTMTDNGDGTYSYTYTANGEGDITLHAQFMRIKSNDVLLTDAYYYNPGTINDLVCASGTSVTVVNGALKITTTTDGEKKFYFPTTKFASGDNVELSMECARGTETGQIWTCSFNPSTSASSQGYASYWTATTETGGYFDIVFNSSTTVNHTLNNGDIIRVVRQSGYSKLYINNSHLSSMKRSVNKYYMGGYTNKGRIQCFKNIIIKKLS